MWFRSLTGFGQQWQFHEAGADEWLPAQTPGSVYTDLLALGRIPDPFVADNELRVQWVAERDWEYRLLFPIAPDALAEDHVFLVCDGLDTLAEVSLNGQPLGRAGNMFRQYRWEVKPLLREGENELRILFRSPIQYITAQQAARPLKSVAQQPAGAPHIRKAPCQFGWDWGPMLPPIGIWKEIRLEGRSVARLADVHLRQRHAEGVSISARVTVEQWQEADLRAVLRLTAPDGQLQEATGGVGVLEIEVARPQLWWPNGYGPQPLYDVELALYSGETLLDRRLFRLGLRTLELRRAPDEWGESFTFVVNGVPIFAKGSNWIPADSFPTRISDAYLEHLIRSAAETHQNMLRVWGGGFYEEERFYDLCDRYGILVWQDCIFSCSIYPLDEPAFLDNVRAEIAENVRRIRHRASLALWCGNNEMEWGWESWGWAKLDFEDQLMPFVEQVPQLKWLLRLANQRDLLPDWRELRDAYVRFFHATLPAWIAELDPDTPYWPSSPSSDRPFQDVNSEERGDAHYWGVWHGREPFTAYRQHYPRFMSEFGFQSLPPLETIRTYAEEADWNMTSYIMEHHQRSGSGNGLMIAQMTDTFRMPKDFPSLVYLSLVLQAEGIRYGVEHWRRHKQRISGTLYWQLDDCWPVASWSSIDYFGRWKALHYAARRFFAPVLLSAEDVGERVSLHVTSDLGDVWQGQVRWSLETLDGAVLEAGAESVVAPAFCSLQVCDLDFTGRVDSESRRDVVLVYELWHGDERISSGVTTFAPNKHLNLRDPELYWEVQASGDGFRIEVCARRLARFVELVLDGVDGYVHFSDNYFDLPAGRSATVTLPALEGWTVERVRESLRVRSLTDSF